MTSGTIKVFIKAVKSIFRITLCDELDEIEYEREALAGGERNYHKEDYDGFSCDNIAKTINDTINSLFKFNEFADKLVNIEMFDDVYPFSHVMDEYKFYVNGDDIFTIMYSCNEFAEYKYSLDDEYDDDEH